MPICHKITFERRPRQNIRFQNWPMENPASIVDMAAKTAKEYLQHLNVPCATVLTIINKGLLEQSLNGWFTQKKKTGKEKKLINTM